MITINLIGESQFITNTSRENPYYGVYSANTACTYAFWVKSLDNNQEKTFLLNDMSVAAGVYNVFNVTGTTGTESLSTGVVDLRPAGKYEYSIYGVTGTTINDIDTSCTLEVGILNVINNE